MSVWRAIVLGVVQGVTEFLPISSKTHLVVVPALLNWKPPSLQFIVLLHLGTLAALLVYFARDLAQMAAGLGRTGSDGRRTVGLLALATVPAAVLGLLFEATFERLLSRPRAAAFSLLATAVIIVGAELIARRRRVAASDDRIGIGAAVGMGLAQAVALLPGVSRSGSTIGAGLAMGVTRTAAARFSFLMAIAAIAGANVVELPKLAAGGVGWPELAGFAAAMASGYASVALLLRMLRRRSLAWFAIYCVVFGAGAGLTLR